MTVDRSLKIQSRLARARSVLSRVERLAELKEAGRWKEGDSIFGLAKVRVRKMRRKVKTAKAEAAEAAAPVAAAGAAAPGAKGAAAPAAKGVAAPAAKGAAPAAKAAKPEAGKKGK